MIRSGVRAVPLAFAAAIALGWGNCVHFCEAGLETVEGGKAKQISADGKEPLPGATVVGRLEELRSVWSEVFKTGEAEK